MSQLKLAKKKPLTPRQLQTLRARYRALQAGLSQLGWVTQGSVTPGSTGAWRWTRKEKAKTVTVALSEEQARIFKEAINNHRQLEKTVRQMRAITQQVLLFSIPGPRRRRARLSS
jgi:hypothetical protein